MYTLRCTGKLLARLGPITEAAREPPSTVLGDWYGTLVHAPGMQLVLLVSERTLFPLVVPAREARTLSERIPIALGRALAQLGVSLPVIDREVQSMAGQRIGRTVSRQILGSMNDFQQMMMAHPWPRARSPRSRWNWPRPPAGPSACGARTT